MSAVIDPLAAGHRGWWACDDVLVFHESAATLPAKLSTRREPDLRTEHFRVYADADRVTFAHDLHPDDLDDDVSGLLVRELGDTGYLTERFPRVVTGIVRSTVADPVVAWTLFYANTLAAFRDPDPAGSIADFAPVHERALTLLRGQTVLDLGSCFGFLPLRMAAAGHRAIASDIVAGSMTLLRTVAARMGTALAAIACDAARVPLADNSVDTVTAVHLIEHVDARTGAAVLAETVRLARRRVVIAVPYEDVPEPAYGHLRCFDADILAALGATTGHRHTVTEHHGGWLVVDLD